MKEVKRKIESAWCKKGMGNSNVVTAYGIGADGKIDRSKETEYKIHEALRSLFKAATMAGFNSKVNFVSLETMMDGPVAANESAPTDTVEEEEREEEYDSERDDHYFDENGNGDKEEGAVEEGSEEDGDEGGSEEEASGDRKIRWEGEGGEVADELGALFGHARPPARRG